MIQRLAIPTIIILFSACNAPSSQTSKSKQWIDIDTLKGTYFLTTIGTHDSLWTYDKPPHTTENKMAVKLDGRTLILYTLKQGDHWDSTIAELIWQDEKLLIKSIDSVSMEITQLNSHQLSYTPLDSSFIHFGVDYVFTKLKNNVVSDLNGVWIMDSIRWLTGSHKFSTSQNRTETYHFVSDSLLFYSGVAYNVYGVPMPRSFDSTFYRIRKDTLFLNYSHYSDAHDTMLINRLNNLGLLELTSIEHNKPDLIGYWHRFELK